MNETSATNLAQDRPFIYIGALVRTGSTLLSEALTALPHSYIFHEPHLGRNLLAWDPVDLARWRESGVDLARGAPWIKALALLFRLVQVREGFVLQGVKQRLFPELAWHARQLGVKEIRNEGWRSYARHFPGLKILLTGRDPRDIYLSLQAHAVRKGAASPPEPAAVAGSLLREFEYQRAMSQAADCLPVRYEDLCTDPQVFDTIRSFVHSPLPEPGPIGAYLARSPARRSEFALHGGEVTDRKVGAWRRERDRQASSRAAEVYERMKPYVDFWGYAQD